MPLTVAPDITLSPLTSDDAGALLAILGADRETFDRWLRWSSTIQSVEDARRVIEDAAERERAGRGFHWGLRRDGQLIGGVVCWSIDPVHRVAELGYWLSANTRGRGLVTRATRMVADHLFAAGQVNRVEFQCRTENGPSRRVAERVGGQFEGIRRQSHLVAGAFRDHAVYAILAGDPPPGAGPVL
ncbi:MAG TPA: GNAT family protein [Galbitalea sp.]|jgi:ribosomal-protein-serine acetyltransferase|nr:GNAT family protein [Galbitalea sp.]